MKNYFIKSIKELGENLPNIPLSSNTIKIAITGLSRAGKTVFITSLIDQLLHQNKLLGVTSNNPAFKVSLKAPLQNAKRFDYYTLISKLKNEHQWPQGTDEISHTILEFESKSRFAFMSNSTFSIELIDYPGEWLLDLALLEMSYEEWSKKTLLWLSKLDDTLAQEYLQTIASLNNSLKASDIALQIHTQYKELLIHLKKNHYSQLTPGRFIRPSDLANDPILHFAPLGENDLQLRELYREKYTTYVKEVVKDIHLEHFKGFERQIVLVDVIEALQNGYECYMDMKNGIANMLRLYDHKNKNFFLQWFSPSIKKVLFVATKADQVAASQHANFAMLLEDMIEHLRHDMDISHIKTDTQIVASLKSTMTIEKSYEGMRLSFIRGILEDDGKVHDLYPGEMPAKFPSKETWDKEAYGYKSFLPPKKPYREDESLEHINMDKLVTKLLGDLL